MKTFTLPEAKEIVRRLSTVYDDELAQALYAYIADRAGRPLFALGIVTMFAQGIDTVSAGYAPVMKNIMQGFIPNWIDALVDDKEVAKEAKDYYEKAANQ